MTISITFPDDEGRDLPEWVQLLLDKVKEDSWQEGFEQGKRYAASSIDDYVRKWM